MYIDRKGWEIPQINVEVELENYPQTKTAQFCRVIDFGITEISEDIKDKLSKLQTPVRSQNINQRQKY
jgi:putative redox protein